MVRQEGGRWDVGTKNNAVYLERRSEDDKQMFDAQLEPEEARELAALLTKYADKADSTDEEEPTDDDGDELTDEDDSIDEDDSTDVDDSTDESSD